MSRKFELILFVIGLAAAWLMYANRKENLPVMKAQVLPYMSDNEIKALSSKDLARWQSDCDDFGGAICVRFGRAIWNTSKEKASAYFERGCSTGCDEACAILQQLK